MQWFCFACKKRLQPALADCSPT